MYFQIFQGVNRRWFWRLYSAENQKLAFSSEGYETKQDALAFIDVVKKNIGYSRIEELG